MGEPLEGKVALITGGASGIGRASALRFAAAGARVVIADVQEAAMAEAVAAIGAERALGVPCDVTDEAAVEGCVRQAVERFGRVEIGLFAAGTGGGGPIHLLDAAVFDRVMRLNVYGVFYSVKHMAAQLIAQGQGGSLIAIASLNAHQVAEGFTAYCTSKAAVAMLMQNAALELGRYGVRANSIGPGLVQTPLSAPLWQTPAIRDAFIAETPMGRYCQPEEVAELALYLASDASRFMTGQTLYLDGGQSLKKYPEMFGLAQQLAPSQ
ncbi:MAG TPA: SDR family oxidoreductase [Dehalococcoidia bacterium]|nr:SDR family oxidoreductase [Dehalococcoidia bacterium]